VYLKVYTLQKPGIPTRICYLWDFYTFGENLLDDAWRTL